MQAVPALDARLSATAGLCRPGLPVADIGCDHGKLTAYLACSGLYPRVIGADLRPGPLSKAVLAVKSARCEDRVDLRLGDGLSVLQPYEVGTVVLAGVSAQTTIEILQAAPWVFSPQGPRLVLVPATKHATLRGWLYQQGFALAADLPVQAGGKWYAVMAADYTGCPAVPTLAQCVYGETGQHPGGADYAALQRGKLRKYRLGLADTDPLAHEIDTLLKEAKAAGLACSL
ncbi:MAG: SAM-dependent methyltransferase [Faecalibacterium sp.]|nr:SAM-dependent methyltransferase [Faecalibacterium sp.]